MGPNSNLTYKVPWRIAKPILTVLGFSVSGSGSV